SKNIPPSSLRPSPGDLGGSSDHFNKSSSPVITIEEPFVGHFVDRFVRSLNRILCPFCDKEALKINTNAVYLKETRMCNTQMWEFSGRRSRLVSKPLLHFPRTKAFITTLCSLVPPVSPLVLAINAISNHPSTELIW
uniref:Zf-RVT domain-containing protein n=1 Tax=Angiostrongylus cantonensis TaxID=6313 RepID=A0A0K0DC97_ANGCA